MISANTTKRIQAISIDGRLADRYFAVTSDVPRNTVEASTSAMPRNGRSARAGADRAADFLAGNGNAARSSLAAAAGGGVTGRTRVEIKFKESDEFLRNDKRHRSATTEIRQPICAITRGSTSQSAQRPRCRRRNGFVVAGATPSLSPARPLVVAIFVVAETNREAFVRYSIGRPRGFAPRGNAWSSLASSSLLSFNPPAAALSAACVASEAFGIASTPESRVRNASAI